MSAEVSGNSWSEKTTICTGLEHFAEVYGSPRRMYWCPERESNPRPTDSDTQQFLAGLDYLIAPSMTW